MKRSVAVAAALVMCASLPSQAFHEYRGPGGGCTPADGEISDQGSPAPAAATVLMLHNTFNDTASGTPVTRIHAGESVRWTWNSAHCHSVKSNETGFYSGFHYPTTEPSSPHVLPGLFDYPVPELEPTLAFTHTFSTPGTYEYACEHHAVIGMQGIVIVD